MIRSLLLLLLFGSWLTAQADVPAELASANVNSRYTIENVEYPQKVSGVLRDQLQKLIGAKYDEALVKELAQRIRRELRAVKVAHRIEKGDNPESVKLYFDTAGGRRFEQAADITKLAYHSKQGVSGGLETGFSIHDLRIGGGVFSDADSMIERMAGVTANVQRTIADRVRLRFDFFDSHQIYNGATVRARNTNSEVSDLYRERRAFRPSVSIALPAGLIYTAALDAEQMQFAFPAVHTEVSNSVMNTLRLRRSWGDSEHPRHRVDAGYSLKTATSLLDSDYIYVRQFADVRYAFADGDNVLILRANAGRMGGRAPLYERFSAGDTTNLRGWNKFDIDPLGGSRMATASVEYHYDNFLVFYDAGSVWDRNETRVVRHGVGAGFGGSGWYLAVAFPIRGQGIQPVFLIGSTF